ncbi:hypothetical protein [Kutzneria buriramensis]|uniref:Uncharacterized protein n=1 Tax=Kutzneria buriramensis TaxID=1045776 RepID=A0A3E0G7K1_9PSEU|nr:hypothetical protein [Kutzneria buriramensis]REH18038.1 hypothetical protein BCF44_13825 [Kutzneria buriramensis]
MISHVSMRPQPRADGWPHSSWQPLPPMWRVIPASGKFDIRTGDLYATWSELVDWVDEVLALMPEAADLDSLVRRDPWPCWNLLCLGCRTQLVDGDEPQCVLRSPDRDELARIALAQGWRGIDTHWLCPACVNGAGS